MSTDRVSQAGQGAATPGAHATGEMARLVRDKDWSQTPLGPRERWSPSLTMTVDLVLSNGFPCLLWWGPDYISIYNDAYRPILGTKHPLALGLPFRDVWPEIADILTPLIDAPFNGGAPTRVDDIMLELERHDFVEETHFTIAYSPVPDATAPGGIGGVLATVHEITDKVVGERRIATLRDLGVRTHSARSPEQACEMAAEALELHSADIPFALFYLVDPSRERAKLAAVAGKADSEFAPPLTVDVHAADAPNDPWRFGDTLRSRLPQTIENVAQIAPDVPSGAWPDPPRIAVTLPLKTAPADGIAGFVTLGVSPRLRFDETSAAFLELVAAQITLAVASAKAHEEERQRAEALAELDRAKIAFFANVSHEFRTPLTLMLGPLEEMRAAIAQSPDGNRKQESQQLDLVYRNSLRLQKLVNTLLDFSRIEAGRVTANYGPVDLASLTADLASVFRSAIEKAGLRLDLSCGPLPEPAWVDREMWEKIVLNLVSNAFKFTFAGSIQVGVDLGPEGFVLHVRDTGAGVPAKDLPRLFDRFHRVDGARGRTHEGSGIGLALVQELVRLHGGTISATSVEGRGTTFEVTIPRGNSHLPADRIRPASPASQPSGARPFVDEAMRWLPETAAPLDTELPLDTEVAPLSKKAALRPRVLIADDNADMRGYLGRLLDVGYEVETVADGLTALERARAVPPDLILADVMMPGLDGFCLLAALRSDERTRAIPVFLVSARAGEEARIEGLDAGADDYIVKPFNSRELLARVAAHIELRRVRDEAQAAVRQSQQRLQRVFETDAVGILIFEAATGTLIDANDGFLAMTGYSRDEIKSRHLTWQSMTPPEHHAVSQQQMERFQGSGRIGPYEKEYFLKDGRRSWMLFTGRDLGDGTIVEFAVDISDRKRREFHLAFLDDIGNDFARLSSPDEIMHAVGSRLAQHLGVSGCVFADVDEAQNEVTVHHGWTAGDVPSLKQTFRLGDYLKEDFIRAGRAGEMVVVGDTATDELTDTERYARLRIGAFVVVPFHWRGRWIGYVVVTSVAPRNWRSDEIELLSELSNRLFLRLERARAEAALRESEERLRLATEVAGIGAFDWNIETGVNSWTPELEAMYGLEPGEFGRTQQSWEQLVHPDDRAAAMGKVHETLASGEPVEHEWRIISRNGATRWIAGRFRVMKDASGRPVRMTGVNIDVTERKEAERARHHLASIVASSSEAVISKTTGGIVTSWNEAAERIFGYSAAEMVGASIRRIIPTDRQGEEDDILARIKRGERLTNYETVRVCKPGQQIDVSVTISPIYDETGRVVGASKIAHDITERKAAEERERLLMHEVNHRSKNMLGLVQAIARQTAAGDPQDFIQRFGERVQALSASQDVLVHSGWRNVPLDALIRAQLGHFAGAVGRRIGLSGPPIQITAAAAQAIGMAVHELATNAAKYGALSNDAGSVAVSWRLLDGDGSDRTFVLDWVESGGPPVAKPTRKGFGSTVTGRMVRMSLDGRVELDFRPSGLSWRLSCQAGKVIEEREQRPLAGQVSAPTRGSDQKRILVVEDEALIAMEIAAALESAGFDVLGPAASVAGAMKLIEQAGCEGAVLDINLGLETAEPIARQLASRGTPFVAITGYGRDQVPPAFRSVPLIGKPLEPGRVVAELKQRMN